MNETYIRELGSAVIPSDNILDVAPLCSIA